MGEEKERETETERERAETTGEGEERERERERRGETMIMREGSKNSLTHPYSVNEDVRLVHDVNNLNSHLAMPTNISLRKDKYKISYLDFYHHKVN
jgi:hypothetical protein